MAKKKKDNDKKKKPEPKVDTEEATDQENADNKKKDSSKKKRLKDFPEHMSIREFVDETGFTVNAVWQMILDGELYSVVDENGQRLIPSFQIGRFIDLDK